MKGLEGKKTYLAAGSLVLLGVVLIWLGQPSLGMISVLQAFGLVGLGDKANRHQTEILAAIQDAGQIAIDLKTDPVAARQELAKSLERLQSRSNAPANFCKPMSCGGTIGLPTAEDLDRVAADEKAKAATGAAGR